MPDPEKAVSEAPALKAPDQDEAVSQPAGEDNEDVVAAAVEAAEGTTEESEETSTSDDDADGEAPAATMKEAEGKEEVDELEEFMKPAEDKKDNVQKRIDQLTAQIKKLEAENVKLKDSGAPSEKKTKYTDEQLQGALDKAMAEGDSKLVWEILKYKTESAKQELIDMYNAEKETSSKAQQAINQEWAKVCNDYGKSWDNGKGKEVYPGAKNELNLANESSLLYRIAIKMYHETRDEDGNLVYYRPGGQRQAVADAVNTILRKRRGSTADPEKKKLERSLAKAKRKASIPSSSSSEGESRKLKSSGDALADYVAERRAFQNERK